MARRRTRKLSAEQTNLIRTVVILAAVTALAAGGVYGLWGVWQGVTQMETFVVRADDPLFESEWIRPGALRQDLIEKDATGVMTGSFSIFMPGLAQRVAAAYEQSPWVRRVKTVRKVFPNRLEIELEVREPFAVVQAGDRSYCVDEDGMVLDPRVYKLTWARLSALKPKVVLTGRKTVPYARRLWADVSVQGGLAMVGLCREQFPETVRVKRIEVRASQGPDGTPMAMAWLVLDEGPRVQWGHVPVGTGSAGEVTTPSKMAALLAVVEKEGGSLGRFKVIDVRWNPPVCEL